ncbi:hypothetical protein [Ferrimonas senticii]|uniref:hypothetical protein n=1 Tax=Ferrimonas senticii TaxID=394566 RepID=UPI00041E0127|nr:hypothetical protein [Ferrimonas senticii]
MSFWTAIVIITAISVGFGTIPEIMKQRNRSKQLGKSNEELEQRLHTLEQQNQQLHERVEVLERIVTDGQYDLKEQFRKLG